MTRQDYRCPQCHTIEEHQVPFGQKAHIHCGCCGALMQRYFGHTRRDQFAVNFGYRESRYSNETDARIAQYQFTHL